MKRSSQLPRPLPFARRKLAWLVAAALSGAVCLDAPAGVEGTTAAELLGIPITFERNDGQYPVDVLFVSQGINGVLALRSGEVAITPRRDLVAGRDPLRLRLRGANLAPEVQPLQPLVTRSYHYAGTSRIENVPHFGELQVKDVYPGIDMMLYGRDGALEYDLVVAPGADPNDIRIDLRGADRVSLDARGDLRLDRGGETLTQHAPTAYQGEGARRHSVPASFELVEGTEGPEARIVVGSYDASAPLTLDPVIGYSSYVGGSGHDGPALVKVDAAGEVFYTLGASGSTDTVVVTRLDPATNTLVYQTSFSGYPSTSAAGLALSGETAYVVGATNSTTFPVVPVKSNSSFDAYVAVIAPSGALTNTRLIGGSASDFATSVAVDASGSVYVGGGTQGNLPITTGPALNGGAIVNPIAPFMMTDGFVAKLDPTTLSTVYLRYVGGSGSDTISSIAVDDAGRAIVAGTNSFGGFPQVNAGTPASPPPGNSNRAFAAKLSVDGASYVFAEYVGGTSFSGDAVAFDPSTGDAIVGGFIFGNGLVPTSARPYGGGNSDAWIVRINPTGTPTFASYIGGSAADTMGGIAVDRAGTVFVTGQTFSGDSFPAINPLPGMSPAPLATNAYVVRFTAGTMDFASVLGGSADDSGRSLAIGNDGSLWVGGFTDSPDFPTVTPYRATLYGTSDGFITQIPGVAAVTSTMPGPGTSTAPGLGGGGPPGLGGGGPPGLGGGGPPGRGR